MKICPSIMYWLFALKSTIVVYGGKSKTVFV